MPNLDFVQFIILMIPGLFSYLIYRSFFAEDDCDHELKLLKVLAFAAPGYFMAEFFIDASLFLKFIISSVTAPIIGIIIGFVTTKYLSPTDIPVRLMSMVSLSPKMRRLSSQISYLNKEYFKNSRYLQKYKAGIQTCLIAKVYSISSPETFVMNEVESWDDKDNIVLDRMLTFNEAEMKEILKNVICNFAIIKVDAGIVIDILCIDKEITDRMFNKKYSTQITA